MPVEKAVEQALPLLSKYAKIGLATSVQHLQTLTEQKKSWLRLEKQWLSATAGK